MKPIAALTFVAALAGCGSVAGLQNSAANIVQAPETVERARVAIALANALGFDPVQADPATVAAYGAACDMLLPDPGSVEGGFCGAVRTALAAAQ